MFVFDFDKFATDFLPPFLRKPKQIAWVKLLVFHVKDLWNELKVLFDKIMLDLSINVTTDNLQAHLRLKYPQVGGLDISILNVYTPEQIYGGYNNEHDAKGLTGYQGEAVDHPIIGYPNEYRHLTNYIVEVPTTYQPNQQDILLILNKYKPAGKAFQIQYI